MSAQKANGIASAQEFQTAAELEREKRAELVKLPSGSPPGWSA